MYKALDPFLNVATWYTKHPEDERRFFTALAKIVKDEDFNADQMGEYMAARFRLDNLPEDHE